MTNDRTTVQILTGPTASGKTAHALAWAKRENGLIVNADSQQVYQEIPILSAQPSPEEQKQAEHRLYGFLPITEVYSAKQWRDDALEAIIEAQSKNRPVMLVGGSGFYIKALIEGLSPIPDISLRQKHDTTALFKSLGPQAFHEELKTIDPSAAERIHPNDRQRATRAWDVYQATGKSLSDWQSEPLITPPADLFFEITVLMPERKTLYTRINNRFELMMKAGAMAEIKHINALDPDPLLPAIKACGIPELRAALKGDIELDKAVQQAKQSSRNYAKRQFTWFRHQLAAGSKETNYSVHHIKS